MQARALSTHFSHCLELTKSHLWDAGKQACTWKWIKYNINGAAILTNWEIRIFGEMHEKSLRRELNNIKKCFPFLEFIILQCTELGLCVVLLLRACKRKKINAGLNYLAKIDIIMIIIMIILAIHILSLRNGLITLSNMRIWWIKISWKICIVKIQGLEKFANENNKNSTDKIQVLEGLTIDKL